MLLQQIDDMPKKSAGSKINSKVVGWKTGSTRIGLNIVPDVGDQVFFFFSKEMWHTGMCTYRCTKYGEHPT